MHGLINRAVQCFARDTYGNECWRSVTRQAGLEFDEFESMLSYDDALTAQTLAAMASVLDKPVDVVLEDIGTYLVSHPNVEALRRLLRFGGVTFIEFLHSLDDLPDRARIAVSDLDLPELELREHTADTYSLTCKSPHPGFGHVLVGILRAMADDYGALVFMEHQGGTEGIEIIDITLIETAFAEGRRFVLGAQEGL